MKKTMTMTTKTHLMLSLSLLMGACTPDEPTSTTEGVQDDMMSCEVHQKTDGTHILVCGDEELSLPFSGPQGEDGQDGMNGEAGMNGRDGTDGQDGINGKDGQDGADGQRVYVTRTRLEKGDDTCPEGGERIELFEGMTDDTPDASFEVCDVVCSEGEVFDPLFGQCIKMVTVHFEGSAWSTMGDIPADFAPTDPIETDALGIDGTPCSGTLRYPFMQDAEFKDEFMALYDFGRFSVTGLEMTLGDKTYTRDPGITGDSISTMYREIYPFGGQGQLNVEVRQTELRDAPVGYQATLVLRGGDESLPYEDAERLLPSPDRVEDWNLLQDEAVETISLEVVDEGTEMLSLMRCRIHSFE